MSIASSLRRKGFTVEQFDSYHVRVNREFDYWLNAKGKPLTWNDRVTGDWGRKPEDQMYRFIVHRLSQLRPEVDEETFIDRLVAIGWTREEAQKGWNERASPG